MTAKKKLFNFIYLLLFLFGGTAFLLYAHGPTVLIESFESKTIQGHSVFNEIELLPGHYQDTWLMKQSHDGLNYPVTQWDEIKIVVKKSQRPYLVSYHQLKDGKEIEFKASCYTCHANGPRLIRPQYDSQVVNYSLRDRLNIHLMNLRMLSYGKVVISKDNYKLNEKFRKVPLKFFSKQDTRPLEVKTCMKCHHSENFLGRGKLLRQHMTTINHLVKHKQMPPWPYELSPGEKKQLDQFLKSF